MKNILQLFYNELQKVEGVSKVCDLVDPWPPQLKQDVTGAMKAAVESANVIDSSLKVNANTTNQSIGNKLEEFVFEKLGEKIGHFTQSKCSGSGYPDRRLDSSACNIAFEIKATGNWESADTNRRVLTSSTEKLRGKFKAPFYHLVLTIVYSRQAEEVTVETLRLDYLEPSTEVNVRYEASVSHKLLEEGEHTRELLM